MPWRPFGRVVSDGRQVHEGTGNEKNYFGRRREGHFSDYVIRAGVATGIEAIGGLIPIVAGNAVVTSADTDSLAQSIGIAVWALCPAATSR